MSIYQNVLLRFIYRYCPSWYSSVIIVVNNEIASDTSESMYHSPVWWLRP